jgi:uncharacterized protein (TIGR01589 family)
MMTSAKPANAATARAPDAGKPGGRTSGEPATTAQNQQNIISSLDVQLVQNLVERCLQLYMNQREVVALLQQQTKIEPSFTSLVWQKLEEQNPEFFKARQKKLFCDFFNPETRNVESCAKKKKKSRRSTDRTPSFPNLRTAHRRPPAGVLRAFAFEGPDLHLQPDARAAVPRREARARRGGGIRDARHGGGLLGAGARARCDASHAGHRRRENQSLALVRRLDALREPHAFGVPAAGW